MSKQLPKFNRKLIDTLYQFMKKADINEDFKSFMLGLGLDMLDDFGFAAVFGVSKAECRGHIEYMKRLCESPLMVDHELRAENSWFDRIKLDAEMFRQLAEAELKGKGVTKQ